MIYFVKWKIIPQISNFKYPNLVWSSLQLQLETYLEYWIGDRQFLEV
jgi:hypothetical protein